MEFFDFPAENPWHMKELDEKAKFLSPRQLEAILTLVDELISRK